MRDQDTGKKIRCPYCASSGNCAHYLALIDQTFNEISEGYAYEKYHEFQTLIEAAFKRSFDQGRHKGCPWNSETLRELWEYAYATCSQKGDDWSVDQYALTRLIIELLEGAGAVRYPGSIESDGAPGFCSAWALFHAKSPQTAFEAALAKLKVLLEGREIAHENGNRGGRPRPRGSSKKGGK
jgi:hypothetical protein